jgi:hypothetical protein
MGAIMTNFAEQLQLHHCKGLWASVLKQHIADLIFFVPKKKVKSMSDDVHDYESCIDWDALKQNITARRKFCKVRMIYCAQALVWFRSPSYALVCNLAGIDQTLIDKYLGKVLGYVLEDLNKKQENIQFDKRMRLDKLSHEERIILERRYQDKVRKGLAKN